MRSEIDQAQAAIEALEILVQVYARERTELTERLKGHLDANKDNLTQRLKEATEQHTKALGNEAQALRNFERQKDLARKGVDSKQAWELAQLKWTQALNEKNAWEAVVGRNQAEINANSQGILLDGYSGTPYAQQRMDELDMRSTEARAKLTQEQTRRDALQRELTLIQRVNWRTLKWLIAILVGTAVGILIYLLDNYKFINHPDELKAAFFCTFMSLLIVAVAALGCISPINRRVRERFRWDAFVNIQFDNDLALEDNRRVSEKRIEEALKISHGQGDRIEDSRAQVDRRGFALLALRPGLSARQGEKQARRIA